MGKRHDTVGIKQVVRLEWYNLALDDLLAGAGASSIRKNLDETIRHSRQSGGLGDRGDQTYTKAVTQIMKCWVSPDVGLHPYRDALLEYAHQHPIRGRVALHWAMTSAAYPFWFNVAFQVGRLLNLQNSVTQAQVRLRCFEALGQRSTVERSVRRVVRTFVAWGVLTDAAERGSYERTVQLQVVDSELATLVLESALLATPGATGLLGALLGSPAFFPFQLPAVSSEDIVRRSKRMVVDRYGLDQEFLRLQL